MLLWLPQPFLSGLFIMEVMMNYSVRTTFLVLLAAASCARAVDNIVNQQNLNIPVPVNVQPNNNIVLTENKHWTELVTQKNTANFAVAACLAPNALQVFFNNEHATAMNYAMTILFGGVAVLRRNSIGDTINDVCSISSGGLRHFSESFMEAPMDTGVKLAMLLAGAYIVGSFVKSWLGNLGIWTHFDLGINIGNFRVSVGRQHSRR